MIEFAPSSESPVASDAPSDADAFSGAPSGPPDPFPAPAPPSPGLSPEAERARRSAVERLGEEIARLSAHITAATARLLAMIRRFDAAEGWHDQGFRSCARWLSWRTGIGPGAAREKVRVARALGELPALAAALAAGELSYSVARAVTRVATPENEAELVAVARHATAAEMERLVRTWRRADRSETAELERERARHADRRLSVVPERDGSWRVSGRLDPEVGAVLRAALEAAGEVLFRGGADDREAPAAARRADALGLVAEAALGQGLGAEKAPDEVDTDDGDAELESAASAEGSEDGERSEPAPAPVVGRAERFQVVVHVPVEALAGASDGDVPAETSAGRDGTARDIPNPELDVSAGTPAGVNGGSTRNVSAGTPRIAGGPAVAAETARRLACDAGLVTMVHGPDGGVLDVGRRRRTVPPALRRALEVRDEGCRFPGCGSRFCDAHHVRPWAEGGETRLGNLVLLCRHHHRRVHEDGWRVEIVEGEDATAPTVRFLRPDGRRMPRVPAAPELPADPVAALEREQRGRGIDGWTATPRTDGVPMDVDWALSALRRPAEPGGRLGELRTGDGDDPPPGP